MSTWLIVRLQYTCELNVVYRHALCKSYKYFNGHYALCRLLILILAPNILNIFEGLTRIQLRAVTLKMYLYAVSSKINKNLYISADRDDVSMYDG